jgi:REP element-mobilizing transposase RayT
MPPIAYFITFRTHATWLPGDRRGYHERHAPWSPQNDALRRWSAAHASPPHLLDARAREVVESAVRDHCNHAGWHLHAANVRTNHVHVVLSSVVPPARVMASLKAWATRYLRQAGLLDATTKPWAQHGSTRYLWTLEAVESACVYVIDGQGGPLES